MDVSINYGSKTITLPFSIYLTDFQLERYPGSNSPSSFASEVVLKDADTEKSFRIFMNNILKYNGFRFFQSSYDKDEKGTILSVNHDSFGTTVTYFGYFFMTLGMILVFFNKNSRIKALIKSSGKLREERKKLFMIIVLGIFLTVPTFAKSNEFSEKHIRSFGKLLIQSSKGRIEPINTLSSEILRKVSKRNNWNKMSPEEVFLNMQANPEKWKEEPVIKITGSELKKILNSKGNYVSFNDLIDINGGYILRNYVNEAYGKKAIERNRFDKEVINVDERANILIEVFRGDFFTVLPVPGDENHKWVSLKDSKLLGTEDESFAITTIGNYFTSVNKSDWTTADLLLSKLHDYQQKYGVKIIPTKTRIALEVIYNNLNLFGMLSKVYMLLGLIMLGINLTTIFNPGIKISSWRKVGFAIVFLLFAIHTLGLGIRWYISEHAPWSNGYESMVFISWATCLAGIVFANRSEITLSLTTILAGLSLMVAGMSWMSPEITNLVPVLKSYWLIVHVAVITSSYGFLGIGALLGLLNLILMIFRNKANALRINFTIKELVVITEIALLIGLILVTTGSFLGGVWANESWGRYWGWDPKETWALVTILVYTFITHMHKIQGFKGHFAMSAAALVGFSSVLMTYFGVNYYLSGLHSYAQGDPPPIPAGVYIAAAVVMLIVVLAYFSERKQKQSIS